MLRGERENKLTNRENECLEAIRRGATTEKLLATALGTSVRTAKYHRQSLHRKLGTGSDPQQLNEFARDKGEITSITDGAIPPEPVKGSRKWNALTVREKQICLLAGIGNTDAEIAKLLNLTRYTVQNRLSIANRVLGFRRRVELAVYLAENKLTEHDESKILAMPILKKKGVRKLFIA
jgi:DNA-binding CsgD family transcriptional regulator